MQIGNLNKIINLFIVGLLVNALIVLSNLYFISDESKLSQFLQGFNSEAAIAQLLLISIPVALFWGVLVEAITEFLRREYIYSTRPNIAQTLSAILMLSKTRLLYEEFLDKAMKELQNDPVYHKPSDEIKMNPRKYWTNIAAALLFRHGTREQIEYAIQHYSMYLLATNFATIVLAGAVIWIFAVKKLLVLFSGLLVFAAIIYFLMRYSTDKFYFTYMHVYRFAFLFARERSATQNDTGKQG